MFKVYRGMAQNIDNVAKFYKEWGMTQLSECPFIFALNEDDNIIGVCEYAISDQLDSVFIQKIYIAPGSRRQKLGDLLIRSVFNYLEASGIYDVYTGFNEAQREELDKFFLASTGFKVINEDKVPESFKEYITDICCHLNLKGFFDKPCASSKACTQYN